MFPKLETERVILRSFQEDDFEQVAELINAYRQQGTENDYSKIKTIDDVKKLTRDTVKADNEFIILEKSTQTPIGWVICDRALGFKSSKRTFVSLWIRDEYRHIGLGREILLKMLNFSFYGIATQNVVTNVRRNCEKALHLMETLGFHQYDYFPKKKPIDDTTTLQFLISKEDYLKQDYAYEAVYDYEPPKPLISPYSYDNPVRKIDGITYIKQPTGYLCGQSVIAMLAGVSVDEVIDVMKNDKGTGVPEIRNTLKYYGIQTATKARVKYTKESVLPECCILSIQLPGYGHWSLYYKGKFYDPEFGEMTELPKKEKLCSYWEIVC